MKMSFNFDYGESIDKLNKLPSNTDTIKQSIISSLKQKQIKRDSILRYLSYTGYNASRLNELSVIHIAGTKGKGSTSAMCESILRSNGYKTGFFSSPHLLSVTERIKLDGVSIQEEYFAKIFSEIYEQLNENQKYNGDMPAYFGFLTVMAFNIFIREKVDVAIIEVGIGGEYDQTNIVSNVPTVGITLLGYDHTNLLGNRIEDIARQKAGIMKPGCKAFTVKQLPPAMEVLKEMANIRQCSLAVVQNLEDYKWIGTTKINSSSLTNPAKYLNASLAIQLAHNWMADNKNFPCKQNIYGLIENCDNINQNNDLTINDISIETFNAIQSSVWPGRCQVLECEFGDYYIDGAHTEESMQVCAEWFKSHYRYSSYRILIFHVRDRNPEPLMRLLLDCNFDMALFVPNVAFDEKIIKNSSDQICINTNMSQHLVVCNENADLWKKLSLSEGQQCSIKVFSNMLSAISFISKIHLINDDVKRPQILITGSLHLVGAALAVLDPLLVKSQKNL
ncbi:folylpolyglutamate synthase, mitochondrial-like isoform X2 [Arctopsyche grandis]|uniref:folylpolyglutamate synthase, mitochondrial-like isoform X2 n=1 Tax=Arctopsyche grandis TaxID=121162 RepID=UPI00406DA3BF